MFKTNLKIFIIGYISNSNPWFCCWQSDFCMTLKNGFDKCSLFVLSPANGWKDQNTDSSLSGQRKP